MSIHGIEGILRIGLPLPLKAQAVPAKIIGLGNPVLRLSFDRDIPLLHRFANAIPVLLASNKGPSCMKAQGLKVGDSPQLGHILEMDKPVSSIVRCYPASLMRAIYLCISLVHDDPVFIWPCDSLCAQSGLPSGCHTSGGHQDIIISLVLVNLRSFCGWPQLLSVKNGNRLSQKLRALGVDLHQIQPVLDAAAAVCVGKYHIGFPIVIPKRAWIDPAPGWMQAIQRKLTIWICGPGYKDPLIRQWNKHVEYPIMKPDGRSPGS